MQTITVIGCGHGGQALAADLTQRGCKVTLYAHHKHPGDIHVIAKAGGIHCKGLVKGFIPLAHVTTDLQQAIANSEYIFIALPSYAHQSMFLEMLPYIQSGQTIITLAANFASLLYLKLLESTSNPLNIDMIDMASLPYVCRADHQGNVEIISTKKQLAAASIPAKHIDKHIHNLSPLFPCQLLAYKNVLSLGMNITSGLTHPAITLLNAGRIGNGKETFYFYRDGITPEIAAIIEKADMERMLIGKGLGLEMYSYLDLMSEYYGKRYQSVYQFYQESPAHNTLPLCPSSLKERYITQDVASLLVPWYCFGKLLGVDSLVMATLINLASLLNNTNYLRTGTNLVRLNLHDKTISEIKQYIAAGEFSFKLSCMPEVYSKQLTSSTYSGTTT